MAGPVGQKFEFPNFLFKGAVLISSHTCQLDSSKTNKETIENMANAAKIKRVWPHANECLQFDKILFVPENHDYAKNPQKGPAGYLISLCNAALFQQVFQSMKVRDEQLKAATAEKNAAAAKEQAAAAKKNAAIEKLKTLEAQLAAVRAKKAAGNEKGSDNQKVGCAAHAQMKAPSGIPVIQTSATQLVGANSKGSK